jgi:integrase/recombinase XerC
MMDMNDYPSFICHCCGVPERSDPVPLSVRRGANTAAADVTPFPDWFSEFLNDRQTRKPSAHTMKAYQQDFIVIATLVTNGDPSRLVVADITKDSMRTAFAVYARDHEAASIRRCWSTWNVLCTFLYTGEVLAANPMQLVGRPKLAKPLPKALPRTAVEALLETVAKDQNSNHQTEWTERDLAIILTALLAGLRAEELRQADVGDIRTTDDGSAVIHVKGKGGKDRNVPIEAERFRSSRPTSTAARSGSPVIRSAKRTSRAPPYRAGPGDPRCSSAATANESTGGRCNPASSEPSNAPAPTRRPSLVRSCTDCAIPTPPSSRTRT